MVNPKCCFNILYVIIFLSFLQDASFLKSSYDFVPKIAYIFFYYIVFVRLFELKNYPFKKIVNKISIDEYIMIAICLIGVIAAFFQDSIIMVQLCKPFVLLIVYIGISSVMKLTEITDEKIFSIIYFYLGITFFHVLIEYIYSFESIVNYISGKSLYAKYLDSSWNFIYDNYNYFARNVMIGFIVSFSLLLYSFIYSASRKKVILYFGLCIFFGFTIFLSFSRTSILSSTLYVIMILVFFVAMFWKKISERFSIKTILFMITTLVISGYILYNYNFFQEIIIKTQTRGSTHRFGLWIEFLKQEQRSFPSVDFFIGHGYMSKDYEFYKIWANILGGHVHNNFLFFWYNFGLISMVLFILLLVKVWISSYKIINKIWYIYFISISYLGVLMFESLIIRKNLRFEVIFFFIFLLLPYNIYLHSKEVLKEKANQ